MFKMRSALVVVCLLAACDNTDINGDFESYDPEDELASAPMMDDVGPAARTVGERWVGDDTRVLVALTAPISGRWTFPGEEPGLSAGDAACQELGADHVCDVDELRAAANAGDFQGVPEGWDIWAMDRGAPEHTTCRGFSYETADQGWSGNNARTVPQDGYSTLVLEALPDPGFDPLCLKDNTVCQQYVPTGAECNVERHIPCCG